jgi:hypothetical protein
VKGAKVGRREGDTTDSRARALVVKRKTKRDGDATGYAPGSIT